MIGSELSSTLGKADTLVTCCHCNRFPQNVLEVLQLWKLEVCNESYRAKIKVSARLVSPGDFKQNPRLFSFSFWKLLAFLGLWLHHFRLYFYPHFASSSDCVFLHPFIKTLVITSGPLVNPGSLPHFKILSLIPLPVPLAIFIGSGD